MRQKFLNRKIFHRIPDIMKLSDVEIGDLVRDVCVRKWAEGGGEGRLAPGVVRGLKRWGSRRRHRTYSSRRKRARGRKTRRRVRMR